MKKKMFFTILGLLTFLCWSFSFYQRNSVQRVEGKYYYHDPLNDNVLKIMSGGHFTFSHGNFENPVKKYAGRWTISHDTIRLFFRNSDFDVFVFLRQGNDTLKQFPQNRIFIRNGKWRDNCKKEKSDSV